MQTHSSNNWTFRERRLLGLNTADRFAAYESAVDAGSGTKSLVPSNPLDRAEWERMRMTGRVMRAVDSRWTAGGKAKATERALREEAEDRLLAQYPELDWKWYFYPFNAAKRRMYYSVRGTMAQEMAAGMVEEFEGVDKELADLDAKLQALGGKFAKGGVRIRRSKKTKKERREVKALKGARERLEHKSQEQKEGPIPPDARRAVEAEKILRGLLAHYGIVEPTQMSALFDAQIKAGTWTSTRLEELIKSHDYRKNPRLARFSPKQQEDLKQQLLEKVKDMRAGNKLWVLWRNPAKWSRAFLAAENPNLSSLRLRTFLREHSAIIGSKVHVAVPGDGEVAGTISARDRNGLVQVLYPDPSDPTKQKLLLLDPNVDVRSEELIGVSADAGGKPREFKVSPREIHLSLV